MKHLLYTYIAGIIFTICSKFKVVSIHDFNFIIKTTGAMLKNISIICFMYKLFTDRAVQKTWNNFLNS